VSDVSRVLFVCVENSNRSQMAEAFTRLLGGDGIEAYSAGSKPSGKVNPKAVIAMQSFGYDLTAHRSKSLDELPEVEFDAVITMGCGDSCPQIPARSRADWALPDPRDMSPEEYRVVCEAIRNHVHNLLSDLGVPVTESSA
jgi:protein-tyrosine-phosphatase